MLLGSGRYFYKMKNSHCSEGVCVRDGVGSKETAARDRTGGSPRFLGPVTCRAQLSAVLLYVWCPLNVPRSLRDVIDPT